MLLGLSPSGNGGGTPDSTGDAPLRAHGATLKPWRVERYRSRPPLSCSGDDVPTFIAKGAPSRRPRRPDDYVFVDMSPQRGAVRSGNTAVRVGSGVIPLGVLEEGGLSPVKRTRESLPQRLPQRLPARLLVGHDGRAVFHPAARPPLSPTRSVLSPFPELAAALPVSGSSAWLTSLALAPDDAVEALARLVERGARARAQSTNAGVLLRSPRRQRPHSMVFPPPSPPPASLHRAHSSVSTTMMGLSLGGAHGASPMRSPTANGLEAMMPGPEEPLSLLALGPAWLPALERDVALSHGSHTASPYTRALSVASAPLSSVPLMVGLDDAAFNGALGARPVLGPPMGMLFDEFPLDLDAHHTKVDLSLGFPMAESDFYGTDFH